MRVLNYGLKKEFLDRYDIGKVLTENILKADLIVEDLLKLQYLKFKTVAKLQQT